MFEKLRVPFADGFNNRISNIYKYFLYNKTEKADFVERSKWISASVFINLKCKFLALIYYKLTSEDREEDQACICDT